jgi:uncharacterized membrane protein YfcA
VAVFFVRAVSHLTLFTFRILLLTEAFAVPVLSWADIVLANLAVCLGATLQGSVGFGLGFVGAPLLMLIDPAFIPGPLLSSGLVLTLLLAHRERRSIDFGEIKWAVAGRFVGVVVAAVVIASISTDSLALMLGILVLVLVGLSLSGLHFEPTKVSLAVAGTVSGFAGTIASVGAPPMAIVYQNAKGPRIRGTLSAFFVVGVLMSITALLVVGRYGIAEISIALRIIPGLLLGFVLSRRLAVVLDRGYTRRVVLGFSAMGGILLVLRELL